MTTETPIIDAAQKAIMECDEESAWDSIAAADCRTAAIAALRAALPCEPTQAWIDAITNWGRAISPDQAHAVWKRQPIMRELYPDMFK